MKPLFVISSGLIIFNFKKSGSFILLRKLSVFFILLLSGERKAIVSFLFSFFIIKPIILIFLFTIIITVFIYFILSFDFSYFYVLYYSLPDISTIEHSNYSSSNIRSRILHYRHSYESVLNNPFLGSGNGTSYNLLRVQIYVKVCKVLFTMSILKVLLDFGCIGLILLLLFLFNLYRYIAIFNSVLARAFFLIAISMNFFLAGGILNYILFFSFH